ncbi:MAG: 50S ribosomal protein L21 [Alphaproteobacteria bacterium]|nr:50S ribosomal protein L21 [Alphaproteobacteria bacterium]
MYAVVDCGSKQYRVAVGDRISVDRLDAEAGTETVLDRVLLLGGEGDVRVGAPLVEGVTVTAKVLSHDKGDKVITYKYKRRHRSRVRKGFRASLTTLEITAINA